MNIGATRQRSAKSPPAGPVPLLQPVRAPAAVDSLPEILRHHALYTTITVAIDAAAVAAAVTIALQLGEGSYSPLGWLPWLFVPLVIIVLAARSMYRGSLRRSFLDELAPVQTSVAVAALLQLTLLEASGRDGGPGEFTTQVWICAAVLISAVRLGQAPAQRFLRVHFGSAAPTLIIGGGQLADQIVARTQQLPEYGLRPVGILDREPSSRSAELDGLPIYDVPYLGVPADFARIARDTGAEEVIIAFSDVPHEDLVTAVRSAQQLGIRVSLVPRLFDTVGLGARIDHLGGMPLLVLPHINPRGWQFVLKGAMDRTLTALGLVVISPLFLTLALLVRLSSPGPVFFKQKRVGRDGIPFDCYKFRSMRAPQELDTRFKLTHGSAPGGVEGVDRRTAIGRIMRKASLDELPQLLNVLKGDMSLVGPRPERPEFVELFDAQIRRYGERHRVKAGLTGWAQVHGLRGQTSIADRAEWDNYYIENWSVTLDIKILFLTVPAVLRSVED